MKAPNCEEPADRDGNAPYFPFSILHFLFRGRTGILIKAVTFLVACIFFLSALPCARAADRGGERPAAYLGLGAGGRQTALGGAGASLPGGLAASLLNPALLTGVRTFQFYTQYAFLTQDRTLAYLALGNRLEKSPLSYSLSWMYFSAGGDLEARYAPSLQPVYTFSDSQMAFIITTAYRLDADWSVGVNFKILTHWLDDQFGWGMGEDLGVTRRLSKDTRVGLSIQDPLAGVKFQGSDSGTIPLAVKAGVSHLFYGPQVIVSADVTHSADLGFEPCGGLEWRARSGIALRAGWGKGSLRAGFGLSIQGSKLAEEFNYTVSQDGLEEGAVLHRVSLGIRFL